MKVVLNVAEKPSVAKEIAKFLSTDSPNKKFNASKYNPIYEFPYILRNEQVLMRVASVSGHIMTMEFQEPFNKWNMVSPEELFTAPISKIVSNDKSDIVNTLKYASQNIDLLALWLDCDREGENIAYEVISIVSQVKSLPTSLIMRAHFSALTKTDIVSAIQNLSYPKQELSEAVDARQEIDLRLGAAFTRLQTLKLRTEAPCLNGALVSWGPCQFPTLGFVVNRYLEIKNFVPEKYWTIDLIITKDSKKTAKFVWKRERLFDFFATFVLYELCLASKECTVSEVIRNPKTKYRPVPLSTVEFIKMAASKLKIGSEKAMGIAEKLYQGGIISYPRTETDSFKSTINLRKLVELHNNHSDWGNYVSNLSEGNFQWPRNGGHDDNSHPPIHPVKSVNRSQLSNDEWRVYEFISRRFLASCSLDAKGFETKIEVSMGGELFECKGLEITESNFLDIYTYMKWNETEVPSFVVGEKIEPSSLMMNEHMTQPPSLLSESDLIGVMDKSGIGTDATIHQHIKTIQDRKYAEKTPAGQFKPTTLGLALVQGYAGIGVGLHEPQLRAKMEREMNEIVNGVKRKGQVIDSILTEMKDVYLGVKVQFHNIAKKVRETVVSLEEHKGNEGYVCFKCGNNGHLANNCDKNSRVEPPAERVQSCFKCGKPGHFSNNCQEIVENAQSDKQTKPNSCYKCGKTGHYANNCPESNLSRKEGKKCEKCGNIGRHPKGSDCLKRNKNK